MVAGSSFLNASAWAAPYWAASSGVAPFLAAAWAANSWNLSGVMPAAFGAPMSVRYLVTLGPACGSGVWAAGVCTGVETGVAGPLAARMFCISWSMSDCSCRSRLVWYSCWLLVRMVAGSSFLNASAWAAPYWAASSGVAPFLAAAPAANSWYLSGVMPAVFGAPMSVRYLVTLGPACGSSVSGVGVRAGAAAGAGVLGAGWASPFSF